MVVRVKIGRKESILIVLFLSLFAVVGFAASYGGSNPPEMGHSPEEVSDKCVTATSSGSSDTYFLINLAENGDNICEGVSGCEIYLFQTQFGYLENTYLGRDFYPRYYFNSGNGDGSDTTISSFLGCAVWDDHSSSSFVDSSDTLVLADTGSSSYECTVSICRVGY